MNASRSTRLLWLLAIFMVGCGLVLGRRAERHVREVEARLDRLSGLSAALDGLQSAAARMDLARAELDALEQGRAPGLNTVLARSAPGLQWEDSRETYAEVSGNWGLRRREVVFNAAPVESVMTFVKEAELCRPPWRLESCMIRASDIPGTGHVVLSFESLERR